jgi:hypothetical protein
MSLIVLLSIRSAKKPIFERHAAKGFASRIWPQFAAAHESLVGTFETCRLRRAMSEFEVPAQPVDATQASNLSAGVSNCKVSRGRSFS